MLPVYLGLFSIKVNLFSNIKLGLEDVRFTLKGTVYWAFEAIFRVFKKIMCLCYVKNLVFLVNQNDIFLSRLDLSVSSLFFVLPSKLRSFECNIIARLACHSHWFGLRMKDLTLPYKFNATLKEWSYEFIISSQIPFSCPEASYSLTTKF